jgi:hypothetical protein
VRVAATVVARIAAAERKRMRRAEGDTRAATALRARAATAAAGVAAAGLTDAKSAAGIASPAGPESKQFVRSYALVPAGGPVTMNSTRCPAAFATRQICCSPGARRIEGCVMPLSVCDFTGDDRAAQSGDPRITGRSSGHR